MITDILRKNNTPYKLLEEALIFANALLIGGNNQV